MTLLRQLTFADAKAQVNQRILALFPQANFDGETVFAAIANAIAGGMITTQAFIEQAGRLAHPSTSEGDELERLAGVWGVVRRAAETDESLRQRLFERIQTPHSGGTAADFRRWVLEVDDVTRVWVFGGAGNVRIGFLYDGRSSPAPTADEREAMMVHLEQYRPAGVRLIALSLLIQKFDIELSADGEVSRETITANLRAGVRAAAFVGDGVKSLPLSVLYNAAGANINITTPGAPVVAAVNSILEVGEIEYS